MYGMSSAVGYCFDAHNNQVFQLKYRLSTESDFQEKNFSQKWIISNEVYL